MVNNCVFCKFVNKELLCHKIWEDENHIAFLSSHPNTKGFSVVITKEHHPSYAFDLQDKVLKNLIIASKKVARLIDRKMEDVGRTGLIFEGFGVNHVHAKLFPMHGTANLKEWKPITSKIDKFFKNYEGYISSHDYKKADFEELKNLAEKIKEKN
jgi:histidine triad (HIT) family protein